jgi:hypothetical protein
MAAADDPGNVGKEAPTSQSTDEEALLRELIEALTALGNYLATAEREFQTQQQVLGQAFQESLRQYERAAGCLRRLRGHLLSKGRGNDHPQGRD